jgi:hypothetical protein
MPHRGESCLSNKDTILVCTICGKKPLPKTVGYGYFVEKQDEIKVEGNEAIFYPGWKRWFCSKKCHMLWKLGGHRI